MVSNLMFFSLLYRFLILALIIPLVACDNAKQSKAQNLNAIEFVPHFNGEVLTCNQNFIVDETQWRIEQLQFFISSIEIKENNQWHKTKLEKSPYQTESIALLGEYCADITQKNWQLNLTNVSEKATEIRFTLGLPFAINHLNPLTQESPLNIPSMFWGWQKGHKFLRLEMASTNDNWLFHLGSVGCKASSPLRAPKQECMYPNRYSYQISLSNPKDKVSFELSSLLNGLKLSSETSCQSSPVNKHCQQLLKNLAGENGLFSTITRKSIEPQ